ncbi:MAG: DEAD/DEAH box helicase, partial [Polyangiales bacterium]
MQSKQRVDFQGRRRQPWTRPQGLEGVLARWQGDRPLWSQICLDHHLPAQAATLVPLPDDVPEALRAALAARGITALYRHQAEAFQWAEQGHSWVVATPTASGKSLAFHLPVLARLAREPGSCALYLYPTKALARDQEESLRQLLQAAKLPQGAITFDGDTPADARKAAKQRAGLLITNPDMLHGGILPHHTDWARVFAQLHYVIVDEVHSYRGVFGSHVAGVMRRLQRVARFHGSDPVFLCASATIGNPAEHAARLVGKEMRCIAASYAPVGPRRVLVYNPPIVNEALGLRASALKSAVRLAGDLLQAEVPTLLFGQSRGSVEVMLKYLRERVSRR